MCRVVRHRRRMDSGELAHGHLAIFSNMAVLGDQLAEPGNPLVAGNSRAVVLQKSRKLLVAIREEGLISAEYYQHLLS